MPEEKFTQAAWTYFVYGLIYMAGAIYLANQGIGARGMRAGGGAAWFVAGVFVLVVVPLLLSREVGWFDRWILSRRDFARLLSLLVAFRAFEVGRIAVAPKLRSIPLPGGGEMSTSLGAGVFLVVTLATLGMLARAAWSPPSS